MSSFFQDHRNSLLALGVAIVAFMMSAYVVPEEEQVVIIRTGNPVGVVNTPGGETGAGLYLRVPFIDSVRRIEKRLLDLEMNDEEVLSADQQRSSGIPPEMVRLSIGLEHIDDIVADLDQALNAAVSS